MNQHGNVEVYQETRGHLLKPHVRQQLRGVDWKHLLESFYLHDKQVINQEIDHVAFRNNGSLVFESYGKFALIGDASKIKLSTKARVVAGFQESRTEMPVYIDRRSDDLVTDPVGAMLDERHIPSGYRNIARTKAASSFF